MKHCPFPLLMAAALALSGNAAHATVAYGDLNNFDTINNTGQTRYGFEIELDDIKSTDITYTYDWNHFGAPIIRQDNSDPLHPKTFVRYTAKTKDANGLWVEHTNAEDPANPIGPTGGHQCTNPSINTGCEHFGVGFVGAPTAIKYNWLIDDGSGGGPITTGESVSVATPVWIPIAVNPAQPIDPVLNPIAQVQAVIPAPVEPIPVAKQFGEPSWVKVIKTTSHNNKNLPLKDLASVDNNGDGLLDWTNGEADEVETEWKLLQTNNGANPALMELAGNADNLPNHDETVTRRYEFYAYGDGTGSIAGSIDGETGEAMCDAVAADGVHGTQTNVGVTNANGGKQYFDCSAVAIVGGYIGAQMAGFDPNPNLGLIDHIQDWDDIASPYTDRTVVAGGSAPYTVTVAAGALPAALDIGQATGILSQKRDANQQPVQPVEGSYSFTVKAVDSAGAVSEKAYTMIVGAPGAQQSLTVSKSGTGSGTGSGTVTGNGIDCGATCSVSLNNGTAVTLTATPAAGSVFSGWGGACAGTAVCNTTMDAAKSVTATFTLQQYPLSVSKAGSGTVTGNGINCGATCSVNLNYGTAVTLTATPAAGSVFSGWSGACAGTAVCNTTMDAAKSVTATFTLQNYTLSVTKSGSGTVAGGPINCGTTCSASLGAGSSVTLTATPASGYGFSGWGGACAGTASTCTVTMNAAQTVSATFVPKYTLTVSKKGGAYGSVASNPAGINCGNTCSSTFNQGTSVILTATPISGRKFAGWSGACSGTATTCSVSMSAKKSVTATFK